MTDATTTSDDQRRPTFCWDRPWTVSDIRRRLRQAQGFEQDRLIAWIMREASISEVWQYLSPREVADCLPRVRQFLGRRKDFWSYIIETWHELGKI